MKVSEDKTLRRAIILLVILVVVIGDYIYYRKKDPGTYENPRSQLISLDKEDIERVEIKYNNDLMEFVKSGDTFRLNSSELKVEDEDIRYLEYSITELESLKTVVEETEQLKDFGLDEPTCEVRIRLVNGEEKGFDVGNTTPTSDTAYYLKMIDASQIYTVSSWDVKHYMLTPVQK